MTAIFLYLSLLCVRNDDIRCLLGDHVDRQSNEGTRNLGESGGIDDTETFDSADLEVGVKNCVDQSMASKFILIGCQLSRLGDVFLQEVFLDVFNFNST